MTDKPIIFSAPMVRALLEGRKTQTRRLLKGLWQSELEGHDVVKTWFAPPDVPKEGIPNQWAQSGIWAEKHGEDGYNRHLGFTAYRPGDRLYVREAIDKVSEPGAVFYRADYDAENPGGSVGLGWRPSIHMPRWASRLTLTVTEVRVQRLQEISYLDTCAEGVDCETCAAMGQSACYRKGCGASREAFRTLWNSLHGPDAWATNPWVVAVSFTVHKGNIDTP